MNELAKLRAKTGLTQAAFAALFDVSDTTVSKWERGTRKPKPYILAALKAKVAEYIKAQRDRKTDYSHRAL